MTNLRRNGVPVRIYLDVTGQEANEKVDFASDKAIANGPALPMGFNEACAPERSQVIRQCDHLDVELLGNVARQTTSRPCC